MYLCKILISPPYLQRIIPVLGFTESSKDGSSIEPVDDEDPALEMHDHVGDGQVDDHPVAGAADILVPEIRQKFG
jgi:hypothetical protein